MRNDEETLEDRCDANRKLTPATRWILIGNRVGLRNWELTGGIGGRSGGKCETLKRRGPRVFTCACTPSPLLLRWLQKNGRLSPSLNIFARCCPSTEMPAPGSKKNLWLVSGCCSTTAGFRVIRSKLNWGLSSAVQGRSLSPQTNSS